MALAVSKAGRLKPEIRLAQALSEYEAILADDQKAKLRVYRQESAPTAADVMRLTAEIDRDTARTSRSRRCVGPRLCNFLQAVQMFAGVVDIFVGGAQSLIASAIWGVVKLSLQLTSSIPSYFEQLSTLLMSIGRTCPRNQEYLLLYPRSTELKEAVCEYFTVTVQLCKQAVVALKKPLLGQLFSAMSNTIMSELGAFEQKLGQLAGAVTAEVSLASKRLQVQEAEQSSIYRLSALAISTQNKKWRKQKRTLRFLDACSIYDYQAAWKQARKQGNVDWFLEETAYTNWIKKSVSSVLYCVGTLGSGKSVLAANVVDDLMLHCQPAHAAYFFCRYDEVDSLLAKTIVGSIARQILQQLELDLDDIISNINTNIFGAERIMDILMEILSTNPYSTERFFIVLDGIDECKEVVCKEILSCLARLATSSFPTFHIFCSGRPDVSQWVLRTLRPDHTLSMSATGCSDEMNQYIVETLKEALETGRLILNNPEIIMKIRDTLLANAHGMYLWVALHIENICSQPTEKAILEALENIPEDLPETFNRILKGIRGLRSSKEYARYASYSVTLFRIVAATRRLLTLDELREAVSIEPGKIAWDPDQLVNDMQKLLKCCGSLLVIDEESFTVRFIHQSVQQFLCSELVNDEIKEYKIYLASADLSLGEICVTYLHSERHVTQLVKREPQLTASSATLRKTIPDSNLVGKLAIRFLSHKEDLKHSMRPSLEDSGAIAASYHPQSQAYNRFLAYAQENWLFHIRQLNQKSHPNIWPLLLRLVAGEVYIVRLPWGPENYLEYGPAFLDHVLKTRQWNLIFQSLVYANSFNIYNLRPLLDALYIIREKETSSPTPTTDEMQLIIFLEPFFATEHRQEWDTRYSSVFCAAASLGYAKSVQCVLDHGVDVNFRDAISGCTALIMACQFGREAVVKLLLQSGADVNLQGEKYGTPLTAACNFGHDKIIMDLLEHGADINLPSREYGTVLKVACRYGHQNIVKLLIQNGANINFQDQKHGTALMAACTHGHQGVVFLLLRNGADVNLQSSEHGTALIGACYNRDEGIVKLLLERGADINLRNERYGTALMAACSNGYESVVELLLYHGADVNSQSAVEPGTALTRASNHGHEKVVKLLLEHGADIEFGLFRKNGTAFMAACRNGHQNVAKLLLDNGASITSVWDDNSDAYYRSALEEARQSGRRDIEKLLIKHRPIWIRPEA